MKRLLGEWQLFPGLKVQRCRRATVQAKPQAQRHSGTRGTWHCGVRAETAPSPWASPVNLAPGRLRFKPSPVSLCGPGERLLLISSRMGWRPGDLEQNVPSLSAPRPQVGQDPLGAPLCSEGRYGHATCSGAGVAPPPGEPTWGALRSCCPWGSGAPPRRNGIPQRALPLLAGGPAAPALGGVDRRHGENLLQKSPQRRKDGEASTGS